MTDHAVLALEHVGLRIGGARILHDVSLAGARGRDARRDRPQRRRQDHPLQRHLRRRAAHRGHRSPRRAGRHARADPPPGHRRPRPHVPDVEPVPGAQRARERPAGRPGARGARDIRLPHSRALRCGDRAPRERTRRGRPRPPAPTPAQRDLAHGEKRKVEIAMLIAMDPEGDPARRADGGRRLGRRAGDHRGHPRAAPGGAPCSWSSTTWRSCWASWTASRSCTTASLLAVDTPEAVMANPTVQSAYLGEAV